MEGPSSAPEKRRVKPAAPPATANERRDALRLSIKQNSEALTVAVTNLERVAREEFTVRGQVRKHPLLWIAASCAVGFYLGWRARRS